MTTNNPLNITDEDIGKEGRFLVDGWPAVLSDIARNADGSIYRLAFKVTDRDGGQWFLVCGTDDEDFDRVARVPRKLYIGVSPWINNVGRYATTAAYLTREEAEYQICEGWVIIEIPHPEDVK